MGSFMNGKNHRNLQLWMPWFISEYETGSAFAIKLIQNISHSHSVWLKKYMLWRINNTRKIYSYGGGGDVYVE